MRHGLRRRSKKTLSNWSCCPRQHPKSRSLRHRNCLRHRWRKPHRNRRNPKWHRRRRWPKSPRSHLSSRPSRSPCRNLSLKSPSISLLPCSALLPPRRRLQPMSPQRDRFRLRQSSACPHSLRRGGRCPTRGASGASVRPCRLSDRDFALWRGGLAEHYALRQSGLRYSGDASSGSCVLSGDWHDAQRLFDRRHRLPMSLTPNFHLFHS